MRRASCLRIRCWSPRRAMGRMSSADVVFSSCPLCESAAVGGTIPSIRKDMSLDGFSYARCGDCGTYYENDVTPDAIDAFYRSLGPYDSASSKDAIAEDLARGIGL